MNELRNVIHGKQKQVENNLVSSQIDSDRGGGSGSVENYNSGSLQQQLEMINKNHNNNSGSLINQKFLDDFKKELGSLKKKQEQHQKIV